MDCVRNLSRDRCEPRRRSNRIDLVAAAVWKRAHPSYPSDDSRIFLPRVASMVHEKEPLPRSNEVTSPTP